MMSNRSLGLRQNAAPRISSWEECFLPLGQTLSTSLTLGGAIALRGNKIDAFNPLAKAIALRSEGFSPNTTDDWLRTSAVIIHLNYGTELLTFLDQLGDTTARLRPWVEALRALQIGNRQALQNIAPEIRTTAEIFYDGMERRLKKLPEATRRRPVRPPKRPRNRRY